jgi:oxygen-dependent protoporphyrinogen oxidase
VSGAGEVEVLVVGAGLAGLAAARELAAAGVRPRVVDAGSRPGGVVQTDSVAGYRVEAGPNTLLARPAFCAFASRHDLWPALVVASPESRRRSLFQDGRLVALPQGPVGALSTPLLSTAGKWRLLAEPFVRRGDPTGESVHDFCARRLGPEVASELVGAFLTGVYAGDERRLGVEAVFPALARLEREHGSLLRGALVEALLRKRDGAGEGDGRGRPGTWSSPGGLGAFASRLAAGLPEPVFTETRVTRLAREEGAWRVELSGPSGGESVRARDVVVAVPAFAAAELLASLAPDAATALAGIEYAPIVALALGAEPAKVRSAIEGFGFLVPRSAGLALLGCLFMSRLFPGRAPEGRELLHCMLGGVRWPEAVTLPDDVVVGRALADLDRTLGLEAAPETVGVRRWPRAIPQPDVDHVRRIAEIERRVRALPRLWLAGSYLAGVSVADTLASGVRAASNVLAAARA